MAGETAPKMEREQVRRPGRGLCIITPERQCRTTHAHHISLSLCFPSPFVPPFRYDEQLNQLLCMRPVPCVGGIHAVKQHGGDTTSDRSKHTLLLFFSPTPTLFDQAPCVFAHLCLSLCLLCFFVSAASPSYFSTHPLSMRVPSMGASVH